MSLSKSWKILPMVAMLALAFSGCAGSKGGSSSEGGSGSGSEQSSGEGGSQSEGSSAPKEEIDTDKLKEAKDEAVAAEAENHELRRQIFDSKNKLGLPVEQPTE